MHKEFDYYDLKDGSICEFPDQKVIGFSTPLFMYKGNNFANIKGKPKGKLSPVVHTIEKKAHSHEF